MNTAEQAIDAALEMFLDPQREALKKQIIKGYYDALTYSNPKDEDPAYLEGFSIGYQEGEMK